MNVHCFQQYFDTAWRSSNMKIFLHSNKIVDTYSGTEFVFKIQAQPKIIRIIHSSKVLPKILLALKGVFWWWTELNEVFEYSKRCTFYDVGVWNEIFQRKKVYVYLHLAWKRVVFSSEWRMNELSNKTICLIASSY